MLRESGILKEVFFWKIVLEPKAEIISKISWEPLRDKVHQDCFGKDFLDDYKAYHFVVAVKDEAGEIVSYTQVKELDGESAYMTFGGTVAKHRNQGSGYKNFGAMVNVLKQKYKFVGVTTKTTNVGMIKLALNAGFLIIGMRLINGIPNLEFLLERGM